MRVRGLRAGVQDECGFEGHVPGRAFCIELTVVDDDGNPPNGPPHSSADRLNLGRPAAEKT